MHNAYIINTYALPTSDNAKRITVCTKYYHSILSTRYYSNAYLVVKDRDY